MPEHRQVHYLQNQINRFPIIKIQIFVVGNCCCRISWMYSQLIGLWDVLHIASHRGRPYVRRQCRVDNRGSTRHCYHSGVSCPWGHPIPWSRRGSPAGRIRGILRRPGTVDPGRFRIHCRQGRMGGTLCRLSAFGRCYPRRYLLAA